MTEDDSSVLAVLLQHGRPSVEPLPVIEEALAVINGQEAVGGPTYIRKILHEAGFADPLLVMAQLANSTIVKLEVRASLLKELAAYLYAKRQTVQINGTVTNEHLVRFISPERCANVKDWLALVQGEAEAKINAIEIEAETVDSKEAAEEAAPPQELASAG